MRAVESLTCTIVDNMALDADLTSSFCLMIPQTFRLNGDAAISGYEVSLGTINSRRCACPIVIQLIMVAETG